MLVLGYYKLTSKKGLPMAKVQCVRDYTPEEAARLVAHVLRMYGSTSRFLIS